MRKVATVAFRDRQVRHRRGQNGGDVVRRVISGVRLALGLCRPEFVFRHGSPQGVDGPRHGSGFDDALGCDILADDAQQSIADGAGLSMAQDLSSTTWARNSSFMLLGGGYFKNDAQVNTTTGVAQIDETLPVVVLGTKSFMQLWHFSGYMISMD